MTESAKVDIFAFFNEYSNYSHIETAFSSACLNNRFLPNLNSRILLKACISTNRDQSPLLELLSGCFLLSGYRAAEREGKSFREFLELKWNVKKYIQRRVTFGETFANGEDHLFGALNMGNAGCAAKNGAYGYYCIVLKLSTFDISSKIVLCKYDTLATEKYWKCHRQSNQKDCNKCSSPECELNVDILLKDYVPYSLRGRLAAIKHTDEYNDVYSDRDIADMIIKDRPNRTEDYIEACYVKNIVRNDIECVRFHKRMAHYFLEEGFPEKDKIKNLSFLKNHLLIESMLSTHPKIPCSYEE